MEWILFWGQGTEKILKIFFSTLIKYWKLDHKKKGKNVKSGLGYKWLWLVDNFPEPYRI